MKNLIVRTQPTRSLIAKFILSIIVGVPAAAQFHEALAQVAPPLGTAQSFAVLGASTVTNTGPTVITGNLGVSPGSAVTGFPPGLVVGGTIHAADAVALQAQNDTTTAYVNLAGQACNTTFGVPTDIGGLTLVPGVYCFSSSAQLTGALTLDAGGNPNAVWVFKVGSTLTTASSSSVLLINGAQACNVFWQVGSSATIGTSSSFIGSILALTSITVTTNATVAGRALARNGAVTLDSNRVAITACAIPPVTPIPPTLNKAFSPATISAGGNSTLTIILSNPNNTAATVTAPLTDTLPSGVVIAGTPSTTCGGTPTVTTSTVTLTGGSIPANGSCTVTVLVTAASGGNYINTLPIEALQTSNGSNTVPAVATLTVTPVGPGAPTIGKAFSPATINNGTLSTLTITLSNPNSTDAHINSPLTDTLPNGVVIAGNAATTCGGTTSVSTSTVTLTGGSIPANGSCTVTVLVTAPTGGSFFDVIPAGALQTNEGINAAPAIATLTVLPLGSSPLLSKAFNPPTIDEGNTSTLTILLSNPNSTIVTLKEPLIDTLPNGVVTSGQASTTCGGGIVSTARSTVTLTGGSIPANGFCTITVSVTAEDSGHFFNTLPAGALQTTGGSNTTPATATLTVMHVRRRAELNEFRLECKYLGAGVVPGKKGGAVIPHECTAEVRFCRRDGGNDYGIASVSANNEDGRDFERCRDENFRDDPTRARMEIECDGRFLFRDRAYREEFAGYEFIFGIPNQLPVIKVPLDQFHFGGDGNEHDDHERNREHAHVVNSWLKMADAVLDGFCAVKERRDSHDHHDHQ